MKINKWPSDIFSVQGLSYKAHQAIQLIQEQKISFEDKKDQAENVKIATVANNETMEEKHIIPIEMQSEKNQAEYLPNSNKMKKLNDLRKRLENFDEFDFKQFSNFVFADGNACSNLMFIGEAPGQEEDRLLKPFVGRSGKLLTLMLEELGLTRDKYYIANVVPWRPPNNRTPTNEEIEKMQAFLYEHINIIEPSLIITVGAVSSKALGVLPSITMAQGRLHEVVLNGRRYKVFPVYHPAYALRLSAKKKELWQSFLKMFQIYSKL